MRAHLSSDAELNGFDEGVEGDSEQHVVVLVASDEGASGDLWGPGDERSDPTDSLDG